MNIYFRGVAVGLTIAWVTSAIAYYVTYYVRHDSSPTLLPKLILLELVVSVIFFVLGYFL
ncbi:MAG: hypothetical protein ACREHC_04835 [Candidatus Levyibacteriota bacterium]